MEVYVVCKFPAKTFPPCVCVDKENAFDKAEEILRDDAQAHAERSKFTKADTLIMKTKVIKKGEQYQLYATFKDIEVRGDIQKFSCVPSTIYIHKVKVNE